MKKKLPFSQRISTVMSSPKFFWAIVGLLIFQATWIALSGRYPMAFDEDFHVGIIRIYAHHLSPFWSHQPAGADAFGAVLRDPSYLYHYLMSFPYRLFSVFTDNQTIQVLLLRFINIGLFATGLILFRRLLSRTGSSKAIVNLALLLFVLLPISPLLAAQINYDNLMLPLLAGLLLMVVRFSDELKKYQRINSGLLTTIVITCLLASLVKYAFLPVFVAVVIYLIVRFKQSFRTWRKFWLSLGFGFTLIGRWSRWLLVAGLLLSLGLFTERYGVNMIRYHAPVVECSKVLSVEQCSHYPPWQRDYYSEHHKPANATSNPLAFGADWFYGMWLRTFFAVDGPASNFETRGPLLLPALAGIIFPVAAVIALAVTGKKLLKKYDKRVLWLFGAVVGVYVAVLWLDGYRAFLRAGQTVAINGRYLLLIDPLLILLGILAINELLKHREKTKVLVASVAVVSLVWGGGALTYFLRGHDAWYWPNQTVRTVNYNVRHSLGPLTPGYNQPNEFMGKN